MGDSSYGEPIWARLMKQGPSGLDTLSRQAWVSSEPIHPATEGCPLPEDWDRLSYAAFDVETTGLYPEKDRILEVGIVLFSFDPEGAIIEEQSYASLVNPGVPVPASSTAIHGITDLDVASAPLFHEIAADVASLLDGRVFVAHNAGFDFGFLKQEFNRISTQPQEATLWTGAEQTPAIRSFTQSLATMTLADTLSLLKLANPALLSYNLGKAAFVLGIETGTSHRALDDARTCMNIFAYAARKLTGKCP